MNFEQYYIDDFFYIWYLSYPYDIIILGRKGSSGSKGPLGNDGQIGQKGERGDQGPK